MNFVRPLAGTEYFNKYVKIFLGLILYHVGVDFLTNLVTSHRVWNHLAWVFGKRHSETQQQSKRRFRLNAYLHNIEIFSAQSDFSVGFQCRIYNYWSLSIDIQLKKFDLIIWFLIHFSYEMWRDGSPRYPDHITGPEPPWERPDFRYLFFICSNFLEILKSLSGSIIISTLNSISNLICVSHFLHTIMNHSLLAFAIGTEKFIYRLNTPETFTFQSCNF